MCVWDYSCHKPKTIKYQADRLTSTLPTILILAHSLILHTLDMFNTIPKTRHGHQGKVTFVCFAKRIGQIQTKSFLDVLLSRCYERAKRPLVCRHFFRMSVISRLLQKFMSNRPTVCIPNTKRLFSRCRKLWFTSAQHRARTKLISLSRPYTSTLVFAAMFVILGNCREGTPLLISLSLKKKIR